MPSCHPYVGFFPALPLGRNLDIGDWLVGEPLPEVRWRSDRFRQLSQSLLASFRHSGFKNGALIWHRENGFDGALPPENIRAAIGAAVAFACFDANDRLADGIKAYNLATTENVAVCFQPIDEVDGKVVHVRPGLLRCIDIVGPEIGDDPLPLPESTLPIDKPVRGSSSLARAVYAAMTGKCERESRGLAGALGWHRIAMTNSPAVSLPQRLVALVTGFEALLGQRGQGASLKRARALNELFARVDKDSPGFLPWRRVLWSPKDPSVLPTNPKCPSEQRATPRTEIQDWFMNLVDARNAIIHEGTLNADAYAAPPEHPLSRYAGSLFWIGERVLREAIKASLGPDVLLAGRFPASVVEMIRSDSTSPQCPERKGTLHTSSSNALSPAAGQMSQSVETILATLACPAANHIRLSKVHGGVGACLETSREHSLKMLDKWEAAFDEKTIMVSTVECELLKCAGAEEELPDGWFDCD